MSVLRLEDERFYDLSLVAAYSFCRILDGTCGGGEFHDLKAACLCVPEGILDPLRAFTCAHQATGNSLFKQR